MKYCLVLSALSLLGDYGADAFTNPVAINLRSNFCQKNTNGCAAVGYTSIQLYATKVDDEILTREIDTASSSSFLQNGNSQVVVDTTGMPTLISLEDDNIDTEAADDSYRRGLTTIGFITLLFASNSPAVHSAFSMTTNTPPCLLINAAVSAVGLTGVVLVSPFLQKFIPDPSKNSGSTEFLKSQTNAEMVDANNSITSSSSSDNFITRNFDPSTIAGAELGLWKTLGTTANIYGLSQTSSDHGAFLIQLTTLIVPAAQGLMGVPIPTRIWTAIGLAMGGVFMFTQDPNQIDSASSQGDLLCALAAIFYATYDLRLFKWGKLVPTDKLITTKMVTQTFLSFGLLSVLGREDMLDFFSKASFHDLQLVGIVSLWSGLLVNCLAPYLQVSGQQAVGPARAQILYASQPLWAAIMGFFLLGEQFGTQGLIGGSAFLAAMFLAATAESPNPNCPEQECEV